MSRKILITGTNSYLGTELRAYLSAFFEDYECEFLSVRDVTWKEKKLQGFDVIYHVAGLVHKKEKPEMEALYDRVNCKLTAELAQKAKKEGVGQFVFVSTMSVYGKNSGRITAKTKPDPVTFYGKSKLAAEQELFRLADSHFKVAVLRPPMIYGKGCKGNYTNLARLAVAFPFFPRYKNERSMLYIGTLCEFVKELIDREEGGIYFPQNKDYMNTSEMVRQIARAHQKKSFQLSVFNPFLTVLIKKSVLIEKIFGSLTYEKEMSEYPGISYQTVDWKQSILETERA